MVEGSAALWFGASGFEVLDVADDGVELVIAIESTAGPVGCPSCGTRARPKDRRWVTVRDAPIADRAVRLRWRKRVWSCPDVDCATRTWTEAGPAEARRVLTTRAETWATDRVAAVEGTPASIARAFGVSWSTVWSAVERVGRARLDGDLDAVEKVGFDETVMQPARRRRRRRFVTAVVDVDSGAILDVFEGRDAQDLRAWMERMPPAWLDRIEVVSLDPHEGYRTAVVDPHPLTGLPSALADVTVVVDPFHVVRVRHEAPCVRGRVRDPPLRPVAAGR
jgi:transposase